MRRLFPVRLGARALPYAASALAPQASTSDYASITVLDEELIEDFDSFELLIVPFKLLIHWTPSHQELTLCQHPES